MFIELTLDNGPVKIPSLNSRGATNEHALWNQIIGTESFPPAESGNFTIKIKKKVSCHSQVDSVEKELKEALIIICKVWIFSGGVRLIYEKEETKKTTIFESNALPVKTELLAKEGKKLVSSLFETSFQIFHEYKQMPMLRSIELAFLYRNDTTFKSAIDYFYNSCEDTQKGFVDLYKIKEVFTHKFGTEKSARENLNIGLNSWRRFTKNLNNYNLRHAEILDGKNTETLTIKEINRTIVSEASSLAIKWIRSYIEFTEKPNE